MLYSDYKDILDTWLGKEKKTYHPELKMDVYARRLRLCDLSCEVAGDIAVDLVIREMKFSDYTLDEKDVIDHWSDIMTDWRSESKDLITYN